MQIKHLIQHLLIIIKNFKMKIAKLLTALFIISFLAGCSDNVNNDKTETKQSGEVKITVVMPNGWTKVENSVLEHQYSKGTASFMIKNEYVLNGKNLDEAVNEAKTTIGKYFESAVFSETKALKIDEYDARSIIYTYTSSAAGMTLTMKMQGVYVMVNTKCYLLSFGDLDDSFENISDDIEAILNNIKFIQ